MFLISRTCLALVVCSILTACSSSKQPETPKKAYVDVPIEDTLRAANVRDNVVLHTHENIGGAAERQTEWADYFYDSYHTGVGEKAPGAEAISDSLILTSKKSVSKDRSVYADRSIYSMNKAKKKAKKSVSKKKPANKPAVDKKTSTVKKTSKKKAKKSSGKKTGAMKPIKSTVVDGKKVYETIVELKDAQ